MSASEKIDLGFIEECDPWKVESRLFPSKVGGKPAWLDHENLPSSEDLQCDSCRDPMIFLCQIYAPFEEDENSFHRTLFLFICRNSVCCKANTNDNVKVFRSHLKRKNKFYPEEPPVEERDPSYNLLHLKLCQLCGCSALKQCGKCKMPYCSRQHQVRDWKESHKKLCQMTDGTAANSKMLFLEYELVIEPESTIRQIINEARAMEEFKRLEADGKTGTMSDVTEVELQAHSSVDEDKIFAQFRKRIQDDPEQVLRYDRGGAPLWIAAEPRPEFVPDCEYCGGVRQYELQVMPQLVSMLEETELDWGILIIYTCKDSCTDTAGYKREYIFKQDLTSN